MPKKKPPQRVARVVPHRPAPVPDVLFANAIEIGFGGPLVRTQLTMFDAVRDYIKTPLDNRPQDEAEIAVYRLERIMRVKLEPVILSSEGTAWLNTAQNPNRESGAGTSRSSSPDPTTSSGSPRSSRTLAKRRSVRGSRRRSTS